MYEASLASYVYYVHYNGWNKRCVGMGIGVGTGGCGCMRVHVCVVLAFS